MLRWRYLCVAIGLMLAKPSGMLGLLVPPSGGAAASTSRDWIGATMPVVEAVVAELKRLGDLAAGSVEASVALALAEKLDRRVSWADAKELRETMAALRALVPPVKLEDRVDEIAQRRASRVGGASAKG